MIFTLPAILIIIVFIFKGNLQTGIMLSRYLI